jgi:hypothetical protein
MAIAGDWVALGCTWKAMEWGPCVSVVCSWGGAVSKGQRKRPAVLGGPPLGCGASSFSGAYNKSIERHE